MNIEQNPGFISFKHLPSGIYIKPVSYDKTSGEVSYRRPESDIVFTCLDYDLTSEMGINHLREVLHQLPSNSLNFKSETVE